ncbi:MAG: M23 family metallopeptidase [Proteobacteria bacterium]|nr:M23 family metallopeptidase [Pseudomonadota bacterium]MCP4917240.1 M23 family metallopeptidase [Pseudomonadota bacterium]
MDLLLVSLVVLAVAWRTPIGSIGGWAYAKVRGETKEAASLVASFTTGISEEFATKIQAIVDNPDLSGVGEGPFPEPYRTAAAVVLGKDELKKLDQLHEGTNPEATLEIHAFGEEQRSRAIQRASSSGEADPESYASYRRYLPSKAQADGDRIVASTLGAAKMLDLAWPVQEDHRLTSPYGYRTHPVLGTKKLHNGVDLAVPEGTIIVAAQDATVSVAGEDDINGKYIVLDHGYGVKTSYCHLSELEVEGGDEVDRGVEIGLSGNTGRSTGPHLHFVLRIGKSTVDPERFRPEDNGVADLF